MSILCNLQQPALLKTVIHFSPFNKDGPALCSSSWTFSHPSLKTHTYPSSYHWITHCYFSTNFKFWWWILVCLISTQHTNDTPAITCGRHLDLLRHYEYSQPNLLNAQLFTNSIVTLPMKQQTRQTWATAWLQEYHKQYFKTELTFWIFLICS